MAGGAASRPPRHARRGVVGAARAAIVRGGVAVKVVAGRRVRRGRAWRASPTGRPSWTYSRSSPIVASPATSPSPSSSHCQYRTSSSASSSGTAQEVRTARTEFERCGRRGAAGGAVRTSGTVLVAGAVLAAEGRGRDVGSPPAGAVAIRVAPASSRVARTAARWVGSSRDQQPGPKPSSVLRGLRSGRLQLSQRPMATSRARRPSRRTQRASCGEVTTMHRALRRGEVLRPRRRPPACPPCRPHGGPGCRSRRCRCPSRRGRRCRSRSRPGRRGRPRRPGRRRPR